MQRAYSTRSRSSRSIWSSWGGERSACRRGDRARRAERRVHRLPFVFGDLSQPRELYREQVSLAIALLLVGVPAWVVHFRMAQAAARRDITERGSALRSLYIHLVVFITALLVFGYGQRALRLVLQGVTFGSSPSNPSNFGLEANWEARAAGAAVMAVTSALVLAYHLRLSSADRQTGAVRGRAAEVRQLALYGLAVVGIFFFSFTTVTTIAGSGAASPTSSFLSPASRPAGTTPGRLLRRSAVARRDFLRFQLLGAIPAIVAGLLLWLGTWIPLQRGLARGPDVEIERRSIVRKFAIYLVVFVSALAVAHRRDIHLASIGRRLLGDPVVEQFNSCGHELGSPVITAVVFGTLWLFHRRVVESEAVRETEVVRAATIRRLYTYLIAAIGLAMAAIGAGRGDRRHWKPAHRLNTHSNGETATYISLLLVGLPAGGSTGDRPSAAGRRRAQIGTAPRLSLPVVLAASSARGVRFGGALSPAERDARDELHNRGLARHLALLVGTRR